MLDFAQKIHSMFGAQFPPWSRSNLKTEIELFTKHWTIFSDLLQLTYWVWYRKRQCQRSLAHRHLTVTYL